jgi:hypothetical protein
MHALSDSSNGVFTICASQVNVFERLCSWLRIVLGGGCIYVVFLIMRDAS